MATAKGEIAALDGKLVTAEQDLEATQAKLSATEVALADKVTYTHNTYAWLVHP